MISDPRDGEQELEKIFGDAGESARSDDEGSRARDWERELDNIVGGAAEAVFESSDEEVEAELRSWGEDPDAVAEEVRGVLLDAVDRYQRSGRPVRMRRRELADPHH